MTQTTPTSTQIEQPRANATLAEREDSATLILPNLALWLVALESFLSRENLPANQSSAKQIHARSWSGEVRIVSWCLLNCSQLSINLQPSAELSAENLNSLQKFLQDSFALAESLATLDKVDSLAWNAWATDLSDDLKTNRAVAQLRNRHEAKRANYFPAALESLAQHSELNGIVGTDVREIFGRLFGMLERLQLIHEMLRDDQPLKPSLLLFALLRRETRELLEMVERTLLLVPTDSLLYEILDGFAYVTPMELRKVYEHELVGISHTRQTPVIFASVENSYGLLKDSFQQAIVALAQVFEPNLSASQVFPNQQTKLEQSLDLRNELWTLLKWVQTIEKSLDPALLAKLNQRLTNFRQGAMLYLMFKDFETTERFIEEIARTQRNEEAAQVLHRFGAYLETLLSQVNMRNIFAGAPFDYPEVTI